MCTVLCSDMHVDHYVDVFVTIPNQLLHLALDVSKYMKKMYPRSDSSRFDTTLRNEG